MQRTIHFASTLLILVGLSGFAAQGAGPVVAAAPAAAHAPLAASTPPRREVFGFALSGTLNDASVGYPSWNFSLLSTVAYFGIHVQADGSFAGDSNWTIWNNTAERTAFVNTAHSHGTKVVMTIVLQDFSPGTPTMCSGLQHSSATVGYAVSQVTGQGVDGLNVDYEGLNGSCGTSDPSWARHAFTNFVSSLRSALPAGSYLSVDTYASSAGDPIGFFDIPGLAPHVDSFFVMAYDLEYSNYSHSPLGCSSFCLGPTAPLTGYYYSDTSTASQYTSVVPSSKVILGVPYYGRKACVSSVSPNQFPNPSNSVVADRYLDAVGEASYFEVQPGSYAVHRDAHDPAGQERWDTWYNTTLKCTRELYWDDATSLGNKYNLVNQDNLRGVGIWTLDYGGGSPELWSALASHFSTIPIAAGNLSACAGNGSATVSWTPASSNDGAITSYQVTANPGGATMSVPGSATLATLTGLTPGTAYTFSVQATNSAGAGVAVSTGPVTPVATAPSSTSYFSWYDNATPGMRGDNIHLLNSSSSAISGCITVTGKAVVPFDLPANTEQHFAFPQNTIGGPVAVTVNSGAPVVATQRVQYYQSFNEIAAVPAAQAATKSYINWFDTATPGMVGDNIHVTNPGGTAASVTVSMPGAAPLAFTVAAGQESHVTFAGHPIGGPVIISSSVPVLASARVQYYQTFNEVGARSAAQATTASYFHWFDRASPGMTSDNIHLVNPGTASATVKVSLPGSTAIGVTVAAGAETYVTFTGGRIGGPVTVTSSQPILTSQRVAYYQSFNEVPGLPASVALATSHLMWFDRASPGMVADNIHLLNPGSAAASVTVSLPGATSITLSLAAGAEAHVTFPAGIIGGPVTVTSSAPILAAQRVEYYQSFNEVAAS